MGGTVFLLTFGAVNHGDEGERLLCVGSKQGKGLELATADLLCYASSLSAGIIMVIDRDL